MSRQRINPAITPVCGWYYRDAETGVLFKETTKDSLADKILKFYSQNDLEAPERQSLLDSIEDFVCRDKQMIGRCKSTASRTTSHYIRGATSKIKAKLSQRYVGDAEAQRRLNICVKCPYNVRMESPYLQNIMGKDPAKRTKNLDNNHLLESCEVCMCPLKEKIHYYHADFTLEEQEKAIMSEKIIGMDGELFNCWQVQK